MHTSPGQLTKKIYCIKHMLQLLSGIYGNGVEAGRYNYRLSGSVSKEAPWITEISLSFTILLWERFNSDIELTQYLN